jgi:hypothetical protein
MIAMPRRAAAIRPFVNVETSEQLAVAIPQRALGQILGLPPVSVRDDHLSFLIENSNGDRHGVDYVFEQRYCPEEEPDLAKVVRAITTHPCEVSVDNAHLAPKLNFV